MKIATLLFTYNRSYHTEQVITALRRNTVLPQKLFVFQDGLKQDSDDCEWNKVNKLINGIDWCNNEIIISEYNKGLSASIVSGIEFAFEKYDAVIVLEDDCVPAQGFISFMTQCFEKYQNDKNVYSVSGYNWPFEMKKTQYDVYGCGRFSSWGWGTWKDRWGIYQKDYELLKNAKQDKELSRKLALWGSDLESLLIANIQGNADSWAVFWIMGIIWKDGICINPYKSLIRNIGMDGSGVHCGVSKKFDVVLDEEREIFRLPDKTCILKDVEIAMAGLCGSYTAACEFDSRKENVLVYGIGNFFKKNEKQINQDYNIEKFVDSYKKGYFAGKEIIKPHEINKHDYDKILIMVQEAQESLDIVRKLLEYKIDYSKIIFGVDIYGDVRR